MKRQKSKIIAAVVIFALLAGAWFYGGNYNDNGGYAAPEAAQTDDASDMQLVVGLVDDYAISGTSAADTKLSVSDIVNDSATEDISAPYASEPPKYSPTTENHEQSSEAIASVEERLTSGQSATEGSAAQSESGSDEDAISEDRSFTVTLKVDCGKVLDNMNLLSKEKHELVPPDGVIFPTTSIAAYEGESVFNVLWREMKQARIHFAFRNTPIYNSAFIEAINNLYEFDAGELSGWMYSVNGRFQSFGCSRYQLEPGDTIEFHYTCDLGRDLGQYWVTGGLADE